ncbi:hypothetical protein QYE76_064722 [Lolium multiflorum]|uniref:RNase H type-1 domain-containing protein n=1 Tax=Lolium multiflorum TaxID=4521 RepID=A0AAD8S9Q9_LOLMU|nr:hypothetical protein QYE76_064722 [Lolium multiflorum]
MKKGKFQPYKDRLGKKLTNWAERYMSMGAKDELIKSVVQAIPIHVMSVFKLPVGFHEDYMRIVRNFWWGEDENKRKVNVDASYCHVSGEAAVGAVVRNHQGQIIVASSKVIEKCQDPEEAEACAILEGLMLAIDNNLEPNSVESDCANAVSNVHRNTGKHSRAWVVYNNIESVSLLIPACKVVKIGRSANQVAHDFAALARKSGESKVWMDPIPPDIQEIAVKDYVSLPLSNI